MALVRNLDELGRDPNPVAGAPQAAFDNKRDSQFLANLIDSFCRVLVLTCCCESDHAELFGVEPAQLGDQFLGEAVAEVILIAQTGEVSKRQDGEHGAAACGWPLTVPRFNRREEAVTTLGQRFDIAWRLRIVSKSGPYLPDAVVQSTFKIHMRLVAPKLSLDFLTAQHPAGAAYQ